MPNKQTVTVEELKLLLLARFNASQSKQAALQARLQEVLGSETQEEKPEAIAVKTKLASLLSDALARRLKSNRRTGPLLSSQDFVRFIPFIIIEIEKVQGAEFAAESRELCEKFMKSMFEGVSEMVHSMVSPRKNPYDEYWRWTLIVLDLAAERSVPPSELLALEEATDEIMRRMFTKRQFVALSKKTMNKFMDVDVLKKIIIQPVLDMVVAGDTEECRALKQELEAELMPQIYEVIEKLKVAVSSWLGEEVGRIYKAA